MSPGAHKRVAESPPGSFATQGGPNTPPNIDDVVNLSILTILYCGQNFNITSFYYSNEKPC
jgi:hypothetical protein